MDDELSSNVIEVITMGKSTIPLVSIDCFSLVDFCGTATIHKIKPIRLKGRTTKKANCQPKICVILPPIRGPKDSPR